MSLGAENRPLVNQGNAEHRRARSSCDPHPNWSRVKVSPELVFRTGEAKDSSGAGDNGAEKS